MKKKILILLLFLIHGIIYAQDDNIIIASLSGYCSGSITKEEIFNDPKIRIRTANPESKIDQITFYSAKVYYFEARALGNQLKQNMLDRIATLDAGNEIHFDIHVSKGDSIVLIHPLVFTIVTKQKNPFTCYNSALANIKGITHGKLSKKELIREGKLTISPKNSEIKLVNYEVVSYVRGQREVVSCNSLEFNPMVKSLIRRSRNAQSIYFRKIKIWVNGKRFFMNPIRIQLK